MGGVTAFHLRILVENPWNGGGGYTWAQVGQMTLDQIFGRLCEKEILKKEVGRRTQIMPGLAAIGSITPDAAGLYKGRDKDGNPIKGRIEGKSKARQLMEAAAARREAEAAAKPKRRRRGR